MYISESGQKFMFWYIQEVQQRLRTLMIIKFNHRVTDLEAIALEYTDLITMSFKVLNLGLEKSNFSDFPIQEDHVSIYIIPIYLLLLFLMDIYNFLFRKYVIVKVRFESSRQLFCWLDGQQHQRALANTQRHISSFLIYIFKAFQLP